LVMLGIQTAITLFTLSYLRIEAGSNRKAKKYLVFLLLTLAVIAGAARGHITAEGQYQFL
jgi:hypothetical protein